MKTQIALTADQQRQIETMSAVCPLELEARKMLATHQVTTEWTPGDAAVRLVFSAQWGSSLPVSRVEEIAHALGGLHLNSIQTSLTKMVNQKLLRSRMIRGVRHYELAFKD